MSKQAGVFNPIYKRDAVARNTLRITNNDPRKMRVDYRM